MAKSLMYWLKSYKNRDLRLLKITEVDDYYRYVFLWLGKEILTTTFSQLFLKIKFQRQSLYIDGLSRQDRLLWVSQELIGVTQ